MSAKTTQLQIRVTPEQKSAIQHRAERAGMTMSDWVLSRLVPSPATRFKEAVAQLASAVASDPEATSHAYAELMDQLAAMTADELLEAVADSPVDELDDYWSAYLAATIELATSMKGLDPPPWTRTVPALAEPHFGSRLQALRLHLLVHSPAPFARRNLFIDSNIGDRV